MNIGFVYMLLLMLVDFCCTKGYLFVAMMRPKLLQIEEIFLKLLSILLIKMILFVMLFLQMLHKIIKWLFRVFKKILLIVLHKKYCIIYLKSFKMIFSH
ncbi:zinc finger MYM-type protein 1-like [Iris pallida]|uniref:Zinc finger MYM-type protein 1-like n=1 Tax=Iris pallida TaxID=29817 RepID=A0AAX6G043_IRIPA|nr:zinc finger MYM-type protein 1-like [Iris pallida]